VGIISQPGPVTRKYGFHSYFPSHSAAEYKKPPAHNPVLRYIELRDPVFFLSECINNEEFGVFGRRLGVCQCPAESFMSFELKIEWEHGQTLNGYY